MYYSMEFFKLWGRWFGWGGFVVGKQSLKNLNMIILHELRQEFI